MRGVRMVVVAAVASAAAGVLADPCQGVDRTSNGARSAALSAAVAEQLRGQLPAGRVVDLASFAVGSWSILKVDTPGADEAFLFYASDPSSSRHVAMWSGAARRDEQEAIEKWARDSAPGIPPSLAECFAWYVTAGRATRGPEPAAVACRWRRGLPTMRGIRPGETTTRTVGRLLGEAPVQRVSGRPDEVLCYRAGRQYLLVLATGYAGPGVVSSVRLTDSLPEQLDATRCAALRAEPPPTFSNGLRLGVGRREVLGALKGGGEVDGAIEDSCGWAVDEVHGTAGVRVELGGAGATAIEAYWTEGM